MVQFFVPLAVAIACLMLVATGCTRQRASGLPYTITYYDRNHDGMVDLELHSVPRGWSHGSWWLVDQDYNGAYDLLVVDGLGVKPVGVLVNVPGGVYITKKLPKNLAHP